MSVTSVEAGSAAGWIETYTGRRFYTLSPNPEDVDIADIAHSLALQCRYGGHSKFFYPVAVHCCVLSDYVLDVMCMGPRDAMIALLHDASEAYVVDVPRPIKYRVPAFREIEAKLDAVVFEKFGLPLQLPGWMKDIDSRILVDERRQVMATNHNEWATDVLMPLGVAIPTWSAVDAEENFLRRFYDLEL